LRTPDVFVTSGVATEVQVKNNFLVSKVVVDVAQRVGSQNSRGSPTRSIWLLGHDVDRSITVLPRVQLNSAIRPLNGKDTTRTLTPSWAKLVLGRAALVEVLGWAVAVTVRSEYGSGLAGASDHTSSILRRASCVQGGVVVLGVVPVLVDVDLTNGWPWVAESPESWPCSTDGVGKVGEACNQKNMIVSLLALNSHAVSSLAFGVKRSSMIYPHKDLLALIRDETQISSIGLSSVSNKAVCGIDILKLAGVISTLYNRSVGLFLI
jgi:hypothetical protein